jgi:hypothetical protein
MSRRHRPRKSRSGAAETEGAGGDITQRFGCPGSWCSRLRPGARRQQEPPKSTGGVSNATCKRRASVRRTREASGTPPKGSALGAGHAAELRLAADRRHKPRSRGSRPARRSAPSGDRLVRSTVRAASTASPDGSAATPGANHGLRPGGRSERTPPRSRGLLRRLAQASLTVLRRGESRRAAPTHRPTASQARTWPTVSFGSWAAGEVPAKVARLAPSWALVACHRASA